MILVLQSQTAFGFLNLEARLINIENYDMNRYFHFGLTVEKFVKQSSKYNDR